MTTEVPVKFYNCIVDEGAKIGIAGDFLFCENCGEVTSISCRPTRPGFQPWVGWHAFQANEDGSQRWSRLIRPDKRIGETLHECPQTLGDFYRVLEEAGELQAVAA